MGRNQIVPAHPSWHRAARTFVAHLHEMRNSGVLAGADPRARFDDFVTRVARPDGFATLFTRYPVLARLLGQTCEHAADSGVELLTRFAADRAEIVVRLLGGVDPGASGGWAGRSAPAGPLGVDTPAHTFCSPSW